jgi:hypothetical protein
MSIEEEKLKLAQEIIELSKAAGLYKPMSNQQYATPELLAASHTIPELKKARESLRQTHILEGRVVVRAAEALGLGRQGWVTAFTMPNTNEVYYRPFYYKKDAEKLRQEVIQHYSSLSEVLGHYGIHFWHLKVDYEPPPPGTGKETWLSGGLYIDRGPS